MNESNALLLVQANQPLQIEQRRCQDTLFISGTGVIAFGFWSVIKTFLFFVLRREVFLGMIGEEELAPSEKPLFLIALAIVLSVLLLMDILLRLYIGLSARAEARGRARGKAYLIVARVLAFLYLVLIVMSVLAFGRTEQGILEYLAEFVMDMTSLVTYSEMVFSAGKLKRIAAQNARTGRARAYEDRENSEKRQLDVLRGQEVTG